jgi:D-alanyl-D-alanine carboxypeptidase/D-alanyl-D-alanine-endopeptidase (penicillin-binding protein 4)
MKVHSAARLGTILVLALGVSVRAQDPMPTTTPAKENLESRVDAVLKIPSYQNAHWGLIVVDVVTGATVYAKNADQMFGPASVTKLFSTAAAWSDLGPDHRFKTPVVRRGDVVDGTLKGDLILVARGDLSMGGRTGADGRLLFNGEDHIYAGAKLVNADPLAGLIELADGVKAAGITKIDGDVLVDDRYFAPAKSSGSGPVNVSPIVINDNLIDVVVKGGARPGDAPEVSIVPPTAYVTYESRVITVESDAKSAISIEEVGPRRFVVKGKVSAGHAPVVAIYEADQPATFARALFIETLRRRGVEVAVSPLGTNDEKKLPSQAEVAVLPKMAEYTSPPFKEFVRVILKVSHNLHASTLPLLIAAHHGERTAREGLKREGRILSHLGVEADAVSFGGGAGGERADLVTPRATVALLRTMASRDDFPAFEDALPVLGGEGTLSHAVPSDSPAIGHIKAKTGTYSVANALNGKSILTSKALAGYIDTAGGRKLAFAFFLNDLPINEVVNPPAAGKLLGRLGEVFYTDQALPSSPRPDAAGR